MSVHKSDVEEITAGLGGGILGAIVTTLMSRQSNIAMTRQVGQALVTNSDKITTPILTRLSKKDEQSFAAIELKLKGEHNGVTYKEILTLLLKRMGPWASDRFRSIVIDIPNPVSKAKASTVVKDGAVEKSVENEMAETGEDSRVQFMREVIEDIIRYGAPASKQTPPNFDAGIEEVLKNLKIRNITDADSSTAKVSRWWYGDNAYEVADKKAAENIRRFTDKIEKREPELVFPWTWVFYLLAGNGALVRPSLWPFGKSNTAKPIKVPDAPLRRPRR